jgi:Divergent InlB B-repeat domain
LRRLTILLAAVGALMLIPAAQAFANEPLTVKITGTGAGKVASATEICCYKGSPAIACEYKSPGPATGTCKTFMSNEGEGWEQVYVNAEAAPGSKFVKWEVKNTEFEACGTFKTCAPYVEPPETGSGEAEVIATFEAEAPKPSIKVTKTGEGTVVSSPAGISCGATCEASFEKGTVKLTASPASGWALMAWSGCTVKVGLTCEVTLSEVKAYAVKVTFVETPSFTIEKAGTGVGKVATTGISCDDSCSKSTAAIKTGASVTVKVTPGKGNEFVGFEGGTGSASGCSGATCTFTISAASSVKAKFSPIPTKTLTVNITGPGAYKGKVVGKGTTVKGAYSTTLSCGAGCTSAVETFFATGTTELVATAATGYSFKGWTVEGGSAGTCTGTTTPCTLLTDANKTVKAKFE